jgi:hypothetical protein
MTSSVLQAQLDDPALPRLVRGYFERTESGPRFTGSHFETLGGAGDEPDVANRFTAADLVAVTTLSVDVPARAAIILLDERATAYAELLAAIPTGIEPDTDQGRRLLTDRDSPLWQLWRELKSLDGIGWVTAGKLCARKRPAIAPVYDQHVEAAVGKPPSWWDMVADEFRDPALGHTLERLADDADVPGHVSRLRLLDAAIWMRQHGHRWLPAGTEGVASS